MNNQWGSNQSFGAPTTAWGAPAFGTALNPYPDNLNQNGVDSNPRYCHGNDGWGPYYNRPQNQQATSAQATGPGSNVPSTGDFVAGDTVADRIHRVVHNNLTDAEKAQNERLYAQNSSSQSHQYSSPASKLSDAELKQRREDKEMWDRIEARELHRYDQMKLKSKVRTIVLANDGDGQGSYELKPWHKPKFPPNVPPPRPLRLAHQPPEMTEQQKRDSELYQEKREDHKLALDEFFKVRDGCARREEDQINQCVESILGERESLERSAKIKAIILALTRTRTAFNAAAVESVAELIFAVIDQPDCRTAISDILTSRCMRDTLPNGFPDIDTTTHKSNQEAVRLPRRPNFPWIRK